MNDITEITKYRILHKSILQVIDMNQRINKPIKLKNKNIFDLKEIVENVIKGFEVTKQESLIEKGHKILDKKYWKEWDDIVPKCCKSIYAGEDLVACLQIIDLINQNKSYKYVEHVFIKQNHSGLSAYEVKELVINFCDKGKNYIDKFII